MTRTRVVTALSLAFLAVAGCTAAPSLEPSASATFLSGGPSGDFPSGCEPLELRGPDGERVDLTGVWQGTGALADEGETAYLNQIGDCVRGVVEDADSENARTLANLAGQLRTDFFMDTEVVFVLQEDVFPYGEYSTVLVAIEWDNEGQLRLREVRDGGSAGRCVTRSLECPLPFIWYRTGP